MTSIKSFILAAILLTATAAGAQTFDITQTELKDLYLDYYKTLNSASQAESYRDVTYWNLFGMRQKGWNGGLRATSIPLPDGNCVWLHADSYFGRISEFRDRMHYNNRVHNAAQIQVGEHSPRDFYPVNEYIGTDPNYPSTYFMAYDWVRHPEARAALSDLELGLVDHDHYLRPLDGTLINSSGQMKLQVLFLSYDSSDTADGMYVAEFSLGSDPSLAGFLHLTHLQRMPYVTDFGNGILEDGEHNYLYGSVPTATGTGYSTVVARTQSRSLLSPWEYYIADESGEMHWQSQLPTMEQLRASKINGAMKTYGATCFKYGEQYFLLSQTAVGGHIQLSVADSPCGPFKSQTRIYTTEDDERLVTSVAAHPHLSRTGELVISYTVDPEPVTVYTATGAGAPITATDLSTDQRNRTGWGSANLNLPHFLRIFRWQKLMKVDDVGCMNDPMLSLWDCVDGLESLKAVRTEIYPTVVSDRLTIQTATDAPVRWSVCAANGLVVMEGDMIGSTTLHVGHLPKGVYLVKVGSADVVRIVKK